jgi:hypothetical protein
MSGPSCHDVMAAVQRQNIVADSCAWRAGDKPALVTQQQMICGVLLPDRCQLAGTLHQACARLVHRKGCSKGPPLMRDHGPAACVGWQAWGCRPVELRLSGGVLPSFECVMASCARETLSVALSCAIRDWVPIRNVLHAMEQVHGALSTTDLRRVLHDGTRRNMCTYIEHEYVLRHLERAAADKAVCCVHAQLDHFLLRQHRSHFAYWNFTL